jgi:hypothetical protein
MHPIRIGLVIALLSALAFVVPTVAASSAKAFHVEKDCAGFTCVITSSTFKGIGAGSVINYSMNSDGSLTAVINSAHGTATGRCDLAPIFGNPSLPGSCVFASGTGALTAFHLDVAVTTTDFVTWFWDGSYWRGVD